MTCAPFCHPFLYPPYTSPPRPIRLGALSHTYPSPSHSLQTGSGKTLAFGIPIVNALLSMAQPEAGASSAQRANLRALVVAPTRELAMQVNRHMLAVTANTDLVLVALVGGMALPKQRRMLSRKPDIVVGTPGRLWSLIQDGDEHLSAIGSLQFLVLDEADRMVEHGHFKELKHIMQLVLKQEAEVKGRLRMRRQTLLYSATLALSRDGGGGDFASKKRSAKGTGAQPSSLDELMALVGRRGKPAIVDLTSGTRETSGGIGKRKSSSMLPSTLSLGTIECVEGDKILYLFYFLRQVRDVASAETCSCRRWWVEYGDIHVTLCHTEYAWNVLPLVCIDMQQLTLNLLCALNCFHRRKDERWCL